MNGLAELSTGACWLVWSAWIVVGVAAAAIVSRFTGRGTFVFDFIIGAVAAVLGGYLTTCFMGDTVSQLILLSILGAVFFSAAALYLTAWLMRHFRRDRDK